MNQGTPLGQDDPSVDAAQLWHDCRDSDPHRPLHACSSCWDGMEWVQEGNKSMQSGTLEAALLVWGSALPSPATPSAALLWDSALAASGQVAPVLALRVKQVF